MKDFDEITDREIFMRVLLLPKEGQDVKPQVFDLGLKATGNGKQKSWLVNYWAPRSTIPVPAAIDGS